jgi:hypothetical protein
MTPPRTPDRVEGHEKRGHRQTQSQNQDQRSRKRRASPVQARLDLQSRLLAEGHRTPVIFITAYPKKRPGHARSLLARWLF